MRFFISILACSLLIGSSIAGDTSTKVCPLLGPAFPAPTGLSSDKLLQAAFDSFNDALTTTLATGISPSGPGAYNATTMSIAMFSGLEEGLIFQRHYTDPSVLNSTFGTKNVNADTVYRLGSIGKLLSTYLFLVQEGDQFFNDPITKYVPELANVTPMNKSRNGATPAWNEITIGQLASHMAGLSRDYALEDASLPWMYCPGLPPIPPDQRPACNYVAQNGTFVPCNTQEYLKGFTAEPALFRSGSTPIYSNNAFVLLAVALENITGSSMKDLFKESIVNALNLHSTSYSVPNNTQNAAIPGSTVSTMWDSELGVLSAAGGYFSSTNDIAAIGRAILNSTLLPPALTRRWMKPVTHTTNVNMAVGAPWEIFRTQVGGRLVDLYTKNGGLGAYATLLVLVPDFNVGFSFLTASALGESTTSSLVYFVFDMLASTMLPALENAAQEQAGATFAGTYAAKDLNSSLTLSVDDQPGLRVTHWINNGTDILNLLNPASAGSSSDETYVDFRIQPNQLYAGNQVGFTGVWQTLPTRVYTGSLDLNCLAWGGVDSFVYGNVGLEDLVFEVNSTTRKAISVQPKALRISLQKMA